MADYQRQQAQSQRRSRLLLASCAVVAVLLVAGVLVTIGLHHTRTPSGAATTTADASVITAVTGVPPATLDSVGAGTVRAYPTPVSGQPALTTGGSPDLPRVLYVGAEYCPYCATERWPMVVALSRFGTFSKLGQTASSSTDAYPNTATLSFHDSTYTSRYVAFTGVETEDTTGQPLDTLAAADQRTFDTYDYPPYVSGDGGSIPFVDLGGSYLISGASYDPQVLQGQTHAQIADALADPTSPIAKAVDGTANVITAAICRLTGSQPASVCTSTGVTAAAAKLTS